MPRRMLCISYRFPPETYPLASRITTMLGHLEETWDITAITAAAGASVGERVKVHHVPPRTPNRLFNGLRRFRLGKLIDFLAWPDPYVYWVPAAYRLARRLIREQKPDLILVFMMPYSTGLVGVLLKRLTGLPLVFNLNDSPTCSDMNPSFPSRLHYRLANWLEDRFIRSADALIYVSGRNVERIRARQPEAMRSKIHLIRRGARVFERQGEGPPSDGRFKIVYTGGMSGWYAFLSPNGNASLAKKLYDRWMRLGRLPMAELDHRSHSPVFLGKAILRVLDRRPEWAGRFDVHVVGNSYPEAVVARVLGLHGLQDVVRVSPPVPHAQVQDNVARADLLFMALPDRTDGTPGGRISAKTYEYLMTDRPILAALPAGENQDFLSDKPGVHLVAPRDEAAMADVIEALAERVFAGDSITVDRAAVQAAMTNEVRAHDFSHVLDQVLGS